MKSFALGIILCVSLVSLGLGTALRPLRSSNSMQVRSTRVGSPSSLHQPPADALLRAYAWSVFKNLTVSRDGNSKTIADWETWTPKCEIGLGPTPCNSAGPSGPAISLMTVSSLLNQIDTETRQIKNRALPTDSSARKPAAYASNPVLEPTREQMLLAQEVYFRSIGPPLQQVHVKSGKDKSDPGPILASVMMNQQAVESIQPLVKSPPAPGHEPTIQSGAILTKAIWTARTLDLNSANTGVCLSRHRPFVTRVGLIGISEGYPSMPAVLPNPNILPLHKEAWIPPEISCEDTDSSGKFDARIPVSRFHAFGVHTKGVAQASPGQFGTVTTEAAGRAAIESQCGNKSNCLALMMGIHIMAKISPADGHFGSDTNPTWVFMTFWWTPDDNGSRLPEPWNHYQLNVTTNPRVDHSNGTADNIIFNPYLEGVAAPAGAEVNCVTCHSLARYNASMTGENLRLDGGSCGNLCIGQSAPHDCGDYGKYLADPNSVPVDRVWSIVSLLDSGNPAAGNPLPACQAPSR
jgi:hypothetical protein